MSCLSVGEVVELTITDLLASGQGVGRSMGMVVFVWGTLPGERARARITLIKAKYAVADLVEVTSRSPQRAVPFCPVFGTCGGCQAQHMDYAGQLAWKRTLVASALRRIGGLPDAVVAATVGMAQPRAYRNKMALVARRTEHGTELGFYKPRSHDLVPIDGCPVVRPQLDRLIARLWGVARDAITASAFDDVRHIVVRAGSGEQAVVSLTTQRRAKQLEEQADPIAAALPGTTGITNSFGLSGANAVLGRNSVTLHGCAEVTEHVEGLRFRLSPSSFFQVNSEMVAQIFRFLSPGVRAGSRMLDLYCGVGTFSLFFARLGARVVGIEENATAVHEARSNARSNGLETNLTFFAARVERVLEYAGTAQALRKADVVFLDPPRKGCDRELLRALCGAGNPHVWYLSCNPSTLARDVAFLRAHGYVLDTVQPFDMFPHTGHVETFLALRRPDAETVEFSGERGA